MQSIKKEDELRLTMRQLSARDQTTKINNYRSRYCKITGMIFIIKQQNKVGKEVLICFGPQMSSALPNCLLIMSIKYVS